jgi:putative ABC transport system ATP-binding protein
MSMLELRRVSKIYGEGAAQVQALADVSLSVDAGSMVAVMGPSGSGKSTLLTIAGSLEEPTEGAVLVDGRALAQMSRPAKAQLRRRVVGYVFQDFNLLPGLTAIENVSLPLELDGRPARKARSIGLQALEQLGLAERSSQYPDQLSGGERQRVAIARAFLANPAILILDEPSAALDPESERLVANGYETVMRGRTTIVITHRLELARRADRVITLAGTHVVEPVF